MGDALVRAAWPAAKLAVEASLTGLGTIRVDGALERSERVEVSTTRLDSVVDVVEALSFDVRDTLETDVSPPAELLLTVSTWRIPLVQVDARFAAPVGGDFHRPPPTVELLSTVRPARSWPLRAGLRLEGHGNVGYRLGTGWEGSRFFGRVTASSEGGLFGGARGVSADVAFGLSF